MRNPFGNLPPDKQPFHGIPPTAVKTYQLLAPRSTHYRKATCEEVDCAHHRLGWATTVAASSQDEADVRRYGGRDHGRHYLEERQPGGFIRFTFPPGQPCFAATTHRVPLEREPLYVVRGGYWRPDPSVQPRRHTQAEHWVEDFGEYLDRLADQKKRG